MAPNLLGLIVLALIVLVWQWQASERSIFFLPTPSAIKQSLATEWFSGPWTRAFLNPDAVSKIGQTFSVAAIGWLVAAIVGISIGAVLGARRTRTEYAAPPLLILRSVPPIAVIPICIVIFGLGSTMRVIVVIVACIWPILLNALSGVAEVDSTLRDVSAVHRLRPTANFLRVLIPAASPTIFSGLRTSLSLAIVLAVGSEMFAGTGGLGGATLAAQSTFNVPALWSALTILALFGLVMNGLLLIIERVALSWNLKGRDN